MIPAAEVICLEAADKYVTVVTASGEALVRMSLRELATRLDGVDLVQIHRGVMVNAACMTTATRNDLGHFSLRLRGLAREVKVSRAFAHLFRPM
jgi:DNA-binding LytR/AlgR family response regulator